MHDELKLSGCLAAACLLLLPACDKVEIEKQEPADTVFLGGKILTVNADDQMVEAIAIKGDRIVAVGSDEDIMGYQGVDTKTIDLAGKTMIPGIIEAHVHSMYVAKGMLGRPYRDYSNIEELQEVIRWLDGELEDDEWIIVPRVPITRLTERRHPTTAELDAACTTHPVVFTSARKSALNSLALKKLGLTGDEIPAGVEVVQDGDGKIRLLGGAIGSLIRKANPGKIHKPEDLIEALGKVHAIYNSVGITSIFERANGKEQWDQFQTLRDSGKMSVRATLTFRRQMNSAAKVKQFVDDLGLKPREGDDWLRAGPLKITADGGIHWGTTYLSEAFGEKRTDFYGLKDDPEYRGNLTFTVDQMADVFGEAHRLGWQMSAHITGDLGITRVLDALDKVDKTEPVAKMRFHLIHAYFSTPDILKRGKRLGVCVDTQSYVYLKDADFIAKIYGKDWAERFIPLGDWYHAGIPVATNSDHMDGLDPDHSINSFNPFLMLYAAVSRKDDFGNVYGEDQKLTRMQALRTVTLNPAFLSFDEKVKGSLEVGKLADLVVLDRDYLECPEDDIRKIKPT
ncbi:MAG: amidohydrolase, partial [Verrucomicrobia bacterium]|nr:amidohydrolase [Verrucomicrobiota bacterium]